MGAYEKRRREHILDKGGEGTSVVVGQDARGSKGERKRLSGFRNAALRMAADHGKFAFRSPHQPMQICGLRRYACGKATGCQPPIVVEAFGIGFD